MRMKALLPLLLLAPLSAQAEPQSTAWFGGEFSADVVMSKPDNPANQAKGKIFVGQRKVRAQGEHQGITKSVIVDHVARKAYTLLDSSKQYHEGIGQAPMPPSPDIDVLPADGESGCNLDKGPKCAKLGVEKVGAVDAEKWQISITNPQTNQTVSTFVWADPQRHVVVRQQSDAGPLMERLLVASEAVEGRATEKWEFINTFNNQTRKSTQWIDAKLRVPVRVMIEGKTVVEVKNIQEGPQAAELFQVPAGYQVMQPQAQPMPPRAGQAAPGSGR